MARYIDADLLLEELKVAFDAIYNDDGRLLYSDHICVGDDVEDLIQRIKRLPTADVVEVVRCKECKHKVDYCGRLMCGRNKYEFAEGVGGLVATLPERFCSDGVRRYKVNE